MDRRHWSDAGPIRKIFKEAFQRGRLPYFNPHSFQKDVGTTGAGAVPHTGGVQGVEPKPGRHEQVLTTFAASRQAAIIRGLSNPNGGNVQLVDLAQQIMQVAQRTSAERSSVL